MPSQIDYVDLGGAKLVQIWDVRGPQFVREDWRAEERFRATIRNVSESKRDTLEGMLFNVALITPFAEQCALWFNERLEATGKKDWNRPTTKGEVLKSWGYYVALVLKHMSYIGRKRTSRCNVGSPKFLL